MNIADKIADNAKDAATMSRVSTLTKRIASEKRADGEKKEVEKKKAEADAEPKAKIPVRNAEEER